MKITQYLRQEKAIAAADVGSIRQRWMWGLRLLRDPDAFAPGSSQLKPGRAEELVQGYKADGRQLSAREIQYRLRCARTYPTETQIANACAQFEGWSDLRSAGFPAYDAPEGEPPADHRTAEEQDHDRARALIDLIGEQGTLFPLRDFEPITTTLKELQDYTIQQEGLTARFVEHGRKRRAYLDRLIAAADFDLSVTWQAAHDRLAVEDRPESAPGEAGCAPAPARVGVAGSESPAAPAPPTPRPVGDHIDGSLQPDRSGP